jgi:hypothetical protein
MMNRETGWNQEEEQLWMIRVVVVMVGYGWYHTLLFIHTGTRTGMVLVPVPPPVQ